MTSYGPVKSENIEVGVRKASTPESDADDHGLAAWKKKRAKGGKVDGEKPKHRMDRRARGGKVNGKGTKINIIIAPQGGAPVGAGGPPPGAMPPAPPPMAAPRPPMPMPPQGAMPPPGATMRKDGGRVHMTASAANGEGRLEKIKAYGKNAKG